MVRSVPEPAAQPAAQPAAAQAAANPDGPSAGLVRQQQAARDALVQAQQLWSAGSHSAATDLLQQAVSVAERSTGSSPSAANSQTLSSLARELARMQLADGRASSAAELLVRLQPQLGQEAEYWALRGNAAQRLGRHQDSVSDYNAALRLRPNEQRWMLGAAVSLAAQGQTAEAGAMAERARSVGPIAAEVRAYLRQTGVPINEP